MSREQEDWTVDKPMNKGKRRLQTQSLTDRRAGGGGRPRHLPDKDGGPRPARCGVFRSARPGSGARPPGPRLSSEGARPAPSSALTGEQRDGSRKPAAGAAPAEAEHRSLDFRESHARARESPPYVLGRPTAENSERRRGPQPRLGVRAPWETAWTCHVARRCAHETQTLIHRDRATSTRSS